MCEYENPSACWQRILCQKDHHPHFEMLTQFAVYLSDLQWSVVPQSNMQLVVKSLKPHAQLDGIRGITESFNLTMRLINIADSSRKTRTKMSQNANQMDVATRMVHKYFEKVQDSTDLSLVLWEPTQCKQNGQTL